MTSIRNFDSEDGRPAYRSAKLALALLAVAVPPVMRAQTATPAKTDPPLLRRLLGNSERFDLGGEIRGRAEGFTALGFVPGADDSYYLHRLRFHAGVRLTDWFSAFAEAQDARQFGYDFRPIPANFADSLDLKQAYISLGDVDSGWELRAGRQELSFGEERLVGAGNWTNTGRSFDAVRVIFNGAGLRMDAFASSVVVPTNSEFDRPHFNNKFYGIYISKTRLPRSTILQPFVFLKTNTTGRGESGAVGDVDEYTVGARVVSQLTNRIGADAEMAFQAGHAASDSIRAWAGHWRARRRLERAPNAPWLVGEYNYASGDASPGDRRRGAFDQLYPTNHSKYGTADRIGWRNIHDVMAGLEWAPRTALRINLDYHSFWLANIEDALYTEAGVAFARNPSASSAHIGVEVDLQVFYKLSTALQFGGGYAHLFPGEYLKETTPDSPVSAWYLMWAYTF